MKGLRGFFFVVLLATTVIAYLVRQRSIEEGEDYATAARGLFGEVCAAGKEATMQIRQAIQDGRLAACRCEEAIERDLTVAGRA
ncbi:MAG: hypothetical protein GX537_06625 [Actinobacteria bacterium]|nr:hypothetical protein [Actinomycetota bacterium]